MHPLEKFKFCPICGSNNFKENNGISKKCFDCGFTYYFNPRAATVAIIRNEKGELLTARRAKEPAKGTMDLPGGFIDSYETAEQGVAREVLEETGLKVDNQKYLFSLPNIYPFSGIDIHTLDLFFECKIIGDAKVKAMDDVAELYWKDIKDINPEDFGLKSVREGVKMYKEMIINKKTF
ncbi:MAG: NUDIX domain-containing protein [Bacteroidales bacterium]|nr:NUDIX domain-containing protein [Bacteroidales bacterium]